MKSSSSLAFRFGVGARALGRGLVAGGGFAVALAAAAFGGAIEGKIGLPAGRTAPVANQRYEIVTKAGVLSTNPPVAVVYLEGSFPRTAPLAVRQMTQKDLMFAPSLLPIQVGTRVEFPNFDPTYHNIFSFSPAKRFDLGRYRSDETPIPSVLFDTVGLVTLRCDIHDHMRALILVLDTPYFVITTPDGRYRLEGIPAGSYRLKAWVDSRTTRVSPVEVTADGTTTVDLP